MVSVSVKRTRFRKMSDVVTWITVVDLTVTVVVSENVPLSTNVNFHISFLGECRSCGAVDWRDSQSFSDCSSLWV